MTLTTPTEPKVHFPSNDTAYLDVKLFKGSIFNSAEVSKNNTEAFIAPRIRVELAL